jgi:uncharacterized membrane protein (UPF0127 family)
MTTSPSAVAPAWVGAVTLCRPDGTVVCGRCVVASSPWRRMRGLLGRGELGTGEGILLRPASAIHCWFMRFAIDAVFLDEDLVVLKVAPDVEPWRMRSHRGAKAVLELAAGEADRRGVEVGDRLAAEPLA